MAAQEIQKYYPLSSSDEVLTSAILVTFDFIRKKCCLSWF